tara:strand:- start:2839 stop:3033 length:195 start_codon:yes stop_codon:yes gene_type:complete
MLNDAEIAVCKAMGLDHAAYEKVGSLGESSTSPNMLSDTELAVCKAMGLDPKDYKESNTAKRLC